jgi:NADH:ubiquinone oxidoreductase subunit 3 (subunit A)
MLAASVSNKTNSSAIVSKKPFLAQVNTECSWISKKPSFLFDKDYLLVIILFMIVLFSAKGFALIEAPSNIVVADSNTFSVIITNESSTQVPLQVNIFSPLKSSVVAPSTIAPNSKATARITISNNKYVEYTRVNATIEAIMGSKIEQQRVTMDVSPTLLGGAAGMFSFGVASQELAKFSFTEWVIFIVLALIAIVLVLGLASKLRR